MPNRMNCDTCDHKKINRDPELHCYMFKVEPVCTCMQHTCFKEEVKAFAAIIKGNVKDHLELMKKRREYARSCLNPDKNT